jgi:hypothetical protein
MHGMELYVVVVKQCPASLFYRSADIMFGTTSESPNIAHRKFKEQYPALVDKAEVEIVRFVSSLPAH